MEQFDIILIGIGLSMDAFAVSICKGLSMKKLDIKNSIVIALYFGLFQAIMPLIGYYLGNAFEKLITSIDHWIALFLLSIIGIKMIKETIDNENCNINDKIDFKTMFPLALSTSIDALAIGITLSFLKVNIYTSITTIGIITTFLTSIGVIIGYKFGKKYEKNAQIMGGVILICLGIKILIDHLF